MAWSKTRAINFQQFATWGESGNLIIKLMICCNDMSLVNQSLVKWKHILFLNIDEKQSQRGSRMYFVRTQMAHIYEGFEIIEAVTNNSLPPIHS
jgi:hypothetical protein